MSVKLAKFICLDDFQCFVKESLDYIIFLTFIELSPFNSFLYLKKIHKQWLLFLLISVWIIFRNKIIIVVVVKKKTPTINQGSETYFPQRNFKFYFIQKWPQATIEWNGRIRVNKTQVFKCGHISILIFYIHVGQLCDTK